MNTCSCLARGNREGVVGSPAYHSARPVKRSRVMRKRGSANPGAAGRHRRGYYEFHERGVWPKFSAIDRPLRRKGVDAAAVIVSLSDSLVLLPRSGPYRPTSTDLVRLSLRGLTFCDEAREDLDRFAATLRYLSKREEEYEPGPAGEDPTVHSSEIRESLGLAADDHAALTRLYTMLQLDVLGHEPEGRGNSGRVVGFLDRELAVPRRP